MHARVYQRSLTGLVDPVTAMGAPSTVSVNDDFHDVHLDRGILFQNMDRHVWTEEQELAFKKEDVELAIRFVEMKRDYERENVGKEIDKGTKARDFDRTQSPEQLRASPS